MIKKETYSSTSSPKLGEPATEALHMISVRQRSYKPRPTWPLRNSKWTRRLKERNKKGNRKKRKPDVEAVNSEEEAKEDAAEEDAD